MDTFSSHNGCCRDLGRHATRRCGGAIIWARGAAAAAGYGPFRGQDLCRAGSPEGALTLPGPELERLRMGLCVGCGKEAPASGGLQMTSSVLPAPF